MSWFKSRKAEPDGAPAEDATGPEVHCPMPTRCTVLGIEVPLTRDPAEFARIVLDNPAPAGLLLSMDEVGATHMALMLTTTDPLTNPFRFDDDRGPCRLVCAGCEDVLDSFRMGTTSPAAIVGRKQLPKCPRCGSANGVIVFLPPGES